LVSDIISKKIGPPFFFQKVDLGEKDTGPSVCKTRIIQKRPRFEIYMEGDLSTYGTRVSSWEI
jgi:hypothetical protein